MEYIEQCYKTKFGVIVQGDILVILKKNGSRSLIKVERFRESASSPEDKPTTMIEYVEIYPEISFEPLISLDNFESTIKETRPVMNISDQEWEEFYQFLRFSKYLRMFEKAYNRFETPDERHIIKRRPFFTTYVPPVK